MTKIYASLISLFCFWSIFFLVGCGSSTIVIKPQDIKYQYVSDNPHAVISTHPSRPFKYGFAYSREECEQYKKDLTLYDIKKGDVVAEVGAASGWLEGVYSVMTDSVTYYVQDIDTILLNPDQLNKMVKYYSSLREKPQTNTFKMVIGTKTATNLPDSTFDKIVISCAFHEFTDPMAIAYDLAKKLKPNGAIIISDGFANSFYARTHSGCYVEGKKASNIIRYFTNAGLYLTNMSAPINSLENDLYFEFNKQKSDDFKLKRDSVQTYIDMLDQFNLNKISSNAKLSEELALKIKPYLNTILRVYPSTETYLTSLGYLLSDKNKNKQSANVFNVTNILFPESFIGNAYVAREYLWEQKYAIALEYFQKALQSKTYDKYLKSEVEVAYKITTELQNKNKKPDTISNNITNLIHFNSVKYKAEYPKENYYHLIDLLNYSYLQNGDIVADIEVKYDFLESCYFQIKDKNTFYIQDDGNNLSNEVQLNKEVTYNLSQKQYFSKMVGSKYETGLPNYFFDKIIINGFFINFQNNKIVIENLKNKLKPNGVIIVFDEFSNSYRHIKRKGYNNWINYETTNFIDFFALQGLYLIGMAAPENSFNNNLCFGLNKNAPKKFKIQKDSVEKYIKILDQFNLSGINRDAETCAFIAAKLKPHIKEILKVYPSTETYLNELGYRILNVDKKTKAAINIFKANATLFPDSWNVYDSLGEAYLKAKEYDLALENYQKALQINPQNRLAQTQQNTIKKIKENSK